MVECSSRIVEVVVYPGQAQVRRAGQVHLEAGTDEVLLPDLPLSLLPESVRVSGRGTAPVRLLGVEVGQVRHAVPPEEELADLEARIERLEDRGRVLAGQIEAVQVHLAALKGLAEAAPERLVRGFTWGRLGVEQIEALLEFARRSERDLHQEIVRLEARQRALTREVERLRRLRQDRQQTRRPDRYAVRVPVEVEAGGDLTLAVTYVCQGATWKPLYDLRLQGEEEGRVQMRLGRIAEIGQKTGEDWTGVQLAVSTARPALTARLPELDPWYVDLYRPAPPPAPIMHRAAVPMAAMEMAAEDTAEKVPLVGAEPPEVEAAVVEASMSQEGAAVIFTAPGRVAVPADGSAHQVFLGSQDLPAQIDWITAPKVEAHVYRRARVQNASPAVLLPGSASLFEGDTFIGTTAMPETPPQGEFEVYLGPDDQVRVERKRTERTVDKGGLVEKVRRIVFGYAIRLHNLRPEAIALSVLDQVPVSRHEAVKVRLLRCEPPATPDKLGLLRWDLSLAAGEERELAFAFQVEMPLADRVVGLD